jgi:hypothetical protein
MADGDLVTLTEYPAGSVARVGPFQPGWNLVAPVFEEYGTAHS